MKLNVQWWLWVLLAASVAVLFYFVNIFYPHFFFTPRSGTAQQPNSPAVITAPVESGYPVSPGTSSVFDGVYRDTRVLGLTFIIPADLSIATSSYGPETSVGRPIYESRTHLQSVDFETNVSRGDVDYAELTKGTEIFVSTWAMEGVQTITDLRAFNRLGRDVGPVLTNERVVRIQGYDGLLYDGTNIRSSDASRWHQLQLLRVLSEGPNKMVTLITSIIIHFDGVGGDEIFKNILDTLVINNQYAEWVKHDNIVYFRGVAVSNIDAATFEINNPGYYGECGYGPSVKDKNGFYIPKDFYLYNFNDSSKYIFEKVAPERMKQFMTVEGCG